MKPKLDVNIDILRLNGHIYAVKRIQAKDIDINAELRELYDKRFKTHIGTLNEGCVSEVVKDWNAQIERLRKYDGRNAKAIPQSMFNKPVMYYNNTLLELRPVIYSPHEVLGMRDDRHFTHIRSKLTEFREVDDIVVTIKAPFSVPIFYGYCVRTNRLYTPHFKTFHTFSDTRVCTGNHSANDFWSLPVDVFQREINRVNLFSPASSEIMVNKVRVGLADLCTPDTFVSVRKRGADTWNV